MDRCGRHPCDVTLSLSLGTSTLSFVSCSSFNRIMMYFFRSSAFLEVLSLDRAGYGQALGGCARLAEQESTHRRRRGIMFQWSNDR